VATPEEMSEILRAKVRNVVVVHADLPMRLLHSQFGGDDHVVGHASSYAAARNSSNPRYTS
jgi:hypothetical protein